MAERAAPVLSKAWAWHPSSSPPQGAWGTVFHHCQCERCFKTYYLPFTVEHGHPPQCATAATHPPGSHTALGHLLHLPKLLSFYSVQGEPTGAAALGEGPEAGAQDDSKPCLSWFPDMSLSKRQLPTPWGSQEATRIQKFFKGPLRTPPLSPQEHQSKAFTLKVRELILTEYDNSCKAYGSKIYTIQTKLE